MAIEASNLSLEVLLSLLPFIVVMAIILIIVFAVVMPNVKRTRERRDMLASLKIGDRVLAVNGARGQIIDIYYDEITVLLDRRNGQMVFPRTAIIKVE